MSESTVPCGHLDQVEAVTPSSTGCEDCLAIGGHWVHLARLHGVRARGVL